MTNKPKKIKNMSMETIMKRVRKMVDLRDEYLKDIDNVHIKLQPGNSKTGKNCYTVSLIPIADCKNCSECKKECYDIINVCFQPAVQNDRARNSAVHMADPKRYWEEISMQVKCNYIPELRLNVGGDLVYEDFFHINKLAKENPKTDILFFTKNYDDINRFLDENEFEPNVYKLLSPWEGMEMDNRHNLPTAHVLYADGRTTAPEFGAIYCGGNCSACHLNLDGCFSLKEGQAVIFPAH